jgi:hypothetical protein
MQPRIAICRVPGVLKLAMRMRLCYEFVAHGKRCYRTKAGPKCQKLGVMLAVWTDLVLIISWFTYSTL